MLSIQIVQTQKMIQVFCLFHFKVYRNFVFLLLGVLQLCVSVARLSVICIQVAVLSLVLLLDAIVYMYINTVALSHKDNTIC